MTIIVQALLDECRKESLNDAGKDRYDDPRLLGYLNEALYEIAVRRPDLFSTQGLVATVPGVYQVAPADSVRLMDVMQVQGGRVVREVDEDALDSLNPNWRNAGGNVTKNWIRYRKDPNRFIVAPPAPAVSLNLVVLYSKTPVTLALTDPWPLQDVYRPSAKHYMVFKTEMPQDESVLSGRALMMFNAFEKSLGASVSAMKITDDQSVKKDQRA